MGVVPFRWQGATRVEQLRALILAHSRAWLRSWAATPEQAECTVDGLPAQRPVDTEAGERWFSMAGAQGTLWLRASPDAIERLGGCLAGTPVADRRGLAAGLGQRALVDWATQIAGVDSAGDLQGASLPQAGVLDARHGVAGFAWALGDARFELYVDAALCAALVPAAASQADLTPRIEAVRPAQVTLHSVLDLGLANLSDTWVLRPGEVIKTGIALTQLVNVQTESGETVFVGALVAHDGHRALRCTRTPLA